MVKHIIVAILLLPVAEIAVFLLVAACIGFLGAFTLMLATTLAGVVVLRRAGRGRIARFRVAVSDGEVTGVEANTGGFLTVLAGLLLVLPGFITDLVGAALLIRPLRQWCGRTFKAWVGRRQAAQRGVIDLSPDEWQQVTDREIENRSSKRKSR
ncbi:MAG: FxsA family protein [Xanthobacteraceae bacterium]|nr:FxsA family protein [Xanthobacteraceae bacterium]